MKIVRFDIDGKSSYGILQDSTVLEMSGPPETTMEKYNLSGKKYSLEEIRLLAPCRPSKVVCVGLNYRLHAEEAGMPVPDKPVIFLKPSTSVTGSGDPVVYPPQSSRVDYEAELGVVMGKKTHAVNAGEALEYVLGYTCGNDVTARDIQFASSQWDYAKGFDTFCPLGPWVETEIDNPEFLEIRGFLNGKMVQCASTEEHIFSVAKLIEYISSCMTLLPGDVIMTGTPSGIGPMNPGDTFEVEISRVGKLRNNVIK